jgi:small subunit ribosomal protein S11
MMEQEVAEKPVEIESKELINSPEKKKKEIEAIVNIYTSFNNTIAHVTDMSGKTITKVTGGMVTKHDRLKANPTIAMFIAKRIAEQVKELGIKSLFIRIRAKTRNPAPGPGANAIVKSFSREGFKIINILDITRVPRGGPKVQGGRRGRRV